MNTYVPVVFLNSKACILHGVNIASKGAYTGFGGGKNTDSFYVLNYNICIVHKQYVYIMYRSIVYLLY